ncbi:MAG: hypothetical protein ABJK83_00195 [Parasphingorhabdus sp.]|uniref:hypothetical protein n=1 Tax=Parasphingorhabdus sp. TaxID=2709688 RepID=UPI003297E4E7
MLSPVAPAIILTLSLTYLMVALPPDPDAGMSESISENMIRHHERHIYQVMEEIVPYTGPELTGENAIALSYTMTAPFNDMGEWRGYAFSNDDTIVIMTFTEPDVDSRFPQEKYTRAASIIDTTFKHSNRKIHAGPASFSGGSGQISIADQMFDVSGVSIANGAMAVVSVYEDMGG